ncbi:malonate decarboxylase holo-[acyl-carrier-protein] synthase [Imbroritus primus]|uniref:malonate decarboxylase holo-[acyl-carrier-protein] synthase n=1 Tax=Imbroritus primus TaxID=3058603 RepID=UPI000269845F
MLPTDSGTRRHSRIWLETTLEVPEIGNCPDARAVQAVLDWVNAGRPLVGRSRMAGDALTGMPLGLALPPVAGTRPRIACCVPMTAVQRVAPPLSLGEVLPVLPMSMQPVARELVHYATGMGMPLGVYGSAFWQHTAGDGYLHADSDLDLLAAPCDGIQACQWLAQLVHCETVAPFRLDGEIRLPDGATVNWRELAGEASRLLVRTDAGPVLRSRAEVWATWDTAAQAELRP